MAKNFYEGISANTGFRQYEDPEEQFYADLVARRAQIVEAQGISDELRTNIAVCGLPDLDIPAASSLQNFDDTLQAELDRLDDLADLENYETTALNLTIKDGAWFTPVAVEDVSHENVGEEATRAIDGDNGTWWQSDAAGLRVITFEVRGYPKRFERIRLRISNAGEGRTQLQDVTIRAAQNVSQIGDPSTIVDAGVDFVYSGSAWMEHVFTSPVFAKRYVRLESSLSLHADPDQLRIREIHVRVGVTNHNK